MRPKNENIHVQLSQKIKESKLQSKVRFSAKSGRESDI